KTVDKLLGPQSDQHYLLRGTKEDGKPTWSPTKGKFTALPATASGLQQLSQRIQERFDKLKREENLAPSDFEVVFVVTNHGSLKLSGEQNDYGFVQSHLDASGNETGPKSIWSADLKRFGAALPAGIRF